MGRVFTQNQHTASPRQPGSRRFENREGDSNVVNTLNAYKLTALVHDAAALQILAQRE